MTEMTLEKADRILASYRAHGNYRNMTDLEIARVVDVKSTRLAVALLFVAWYSFINMLSPSPNIYRVGMTATYLGVALFFYFRGRRFAMIRELFESQAPQYLNQLDLSRVEKPAPAHPATEW